MIADWLKSIFELVYPRSCAVCGERLNPSEHTICTRCRWDMPLTDYWSSFDNPTVAKLSGKLPFVHASALMFFRYESLYRRMIHRMKYGSRPDIAVVLGEIFGQYLSQSNFYKQVDLVVAIPLHFTKRIKRGYNQSEEFARGVAKAMKVEYEPNAVKRIKRTSTQAKLKSSKDRLSNVSGAFKVTHPERLNGRNILLVDDVLTTGATIESCGQVIVEACPSCRLWIGAIATVGSSNNIHHI